MLEHQSQARTSVAYGMVDIPHGWRQGLTTVALLAQGHQPVFSVAQGGIRSSIGVCLRRHTLTSS